ncbi:ankyrin repeat domain-containing protein 45-like [Styela clava]
MPAADEPVESEETQEIKFDDDNIVMHCALRGDLDMLKAALDNNDDPHHDVALEKINQRNNVGKTPLEIACMLGRENIVQELIKRGVDVNDQTGAGYSALHIAASWGSRHCLEVLVENGAKLNARNNHGETARLAASRYNKEECVQFLDWAAAKKTLEDFIAELREMISDPEKLQGIKLSKEEKTSTISTCNEKQEWLDNNPEATVTDFLSKKQELEKDVENLLAKINSPPPNTGSTGRK